MSTVAEIERAITQLDAAQQDELRLWVSRKVLPQVQLRKPVDEVTRLSMLASLAGAGKGVLKPGQSVVDELVAEREEEIGN